MFRSVDDFVEDWREESSATLQLLRALSDASLEQRATTGGRTLGRLAWHLTTSLGEICCRAGLPLDAIPDDAGLPAGAAAIADTYEMESSAIVTSVRLHWTDDMLDESVEMYGEQWKRGKVLSVLIRHQAHHRGQMTVLMRIAQLPVSGVYGPSREEWAAMNLPAME